MRQSNIEREGEEEGGVLHFIFFPFFFQHTDLLSPSIITTVMQEYSSINNELCGFRLLSIQKYTLVTFTSVGESRLTPEAVTLNKQPSLSLPCLSPSITAAYLNFNLLYNIYIWSNAVPLYSIQCIQCTIFCAAFLTMDNDRKQPYREKQIQDINS